MGDENAAEAEAVWKQAIEIFNTRLTKDSRKRIAWPRLKSEAKACSLAQLVQATEEAHSLLYGKHLPVVARFQQILLAINKYALVADVLIQHQPQVTALVWGSIRFLIQVSVAEIELGEDIGRALVDIVKQIARFELERQLFSQETRIVDAIANLFAQILNFLVRANLHFARPNAIRAARAVFSCKFSRILGSIEKDAINLDREIRTASEKRLLGASQLAQAEHEAQEAFRTDCRETLRRIEGPDLRNELTTLKKMLEDVSSGMRIQRRVEDFREELNTAVKWLEKGTSRPDILPPREPGTCEWICRNQHFQDWIRAENTQCLWIHGIPGSGKSVLSSFLAENASKSSDTSIVLSYSFHSSLDHKSAQATQFALSLLLQASQTKAVISRPQFSSALRRMTSLISQSKPSADCALGVLLAILESVFDLLPSFTLIVDGLDECVTEDDSFQVSKYLHRLGTRPNSRVIVLSRHSPRLAEDLANATRISMDCVEIETDIKLYLQRRIDRTPKLHKLRREIITKASMDGGRMFLWAKLMLDGLQQCLGTMRKIRERLFSTPAKLFDLYDQQLEVNCLKFCDAEKEKRDEIFLLLLGLKRSLTVQDISAALALDTITGISDEEDELVEPETEIEKLCRPLVMVVGDIAQFVHVSVKEFLIERRMSDDDSNTFLARKSLSKLSQAQYKDWKHAASLLRKNLLAGSVIGQPLERTFKESVFYNYACLHWHDHVTVLGVPPRDILEKLASFLEGTEFVTWSEVLFELKDRAGLGPQIQVRMGLSIWYQNLDAPIQSQVPIKDFFIVPHENLSGELYQKSEDKLLPYLPLLRLGNYFNLGGQSSADWQKAFDYKKTVADGFQDLLGPRNPLTLRAKTSMLQEYFWQKRFVEAETGFLEVAEIQREVLEKNEIDYWVTLQLLGLAQYSVTKFEAAHVTLTMSEKGLSDILGTSHILYLMTGLYKGYVLERQAEVPQALSLYEQIQQKWAPNMGPSNPFFLMLQTAIGSASRKLKILDLAQESLLEAWAARLRVYTIETNVCVDSAIQLALTYREARCFEDAKEVLDVISPSKVFAKDFERSCQVTHIRALLDFDAGYYNRPRMALQKLLMEASGVDRDKNNRELLWVRVDLADVLRDHGEDSEALMLFGELVEPLPEPKSHQESSDEAGEFVSTPSLDGEPEPAARLKIAEQALRLVRSAHLQAAEKLLAENGLRWVRQEDFWILQGGPITDTASASPPGSQKPAMDCS